MTAPLKGLLIDPEKRTITEVEIPVDEDGGCLNGMYKALGCSCVDVGRGGLDFLPGNPDDDVWFDDEGLYSECRYSFEIPGWVPLVGRGLVLGYDAEGECTSHNLTPEAVEILRNVMVWHERAEIGI